MRTHLTVDRADNISQRYSETKIMLVTIGAVLLVLITVVVVILTFRVEDFEVNVKFSDKELPKRKEKREEKLLEEKEELLEDKDQKYLR